MRTRRVKLVQYAILAAVLIVPLVGYIVNGRSDGDRTVAYSELVKSIQQGQVTDATIEGEQIIAHTQDGRELLTYIPGRDQSFIPLLFEHNVTIRALPNESDPLWRFVVYWAPSLAIISVLVYFLSSIDAALRVNAEKLDELYQRMAMATATSVEGEKLAAQEEGQT
jgi:ATP-dependent Zn protease